MTWLRYHLRSIRRYQKPAQQEATTLQIFPQPARPVAAIRLDGGRLCLDFVNTIHDRYACEAEDYICEPERFVEWCVRAGALRPGEQIAAPDSADQRAALMSKMRRLRQHLHALLESRIEGAPPPAEAVQHLDQWLHLAWAGQSLGPDGQMHWREDAHDASLPLKRIALDTLDLIGSPSASRLRRCDNTRSCGWLFLDVSKNQRRRWCAMETCGAAAKMKRYRRSEA